MWRKPEISGLGWGFVCDGQRALGNILGQIANALKVAGDAQGGHDVAQVVSHWLAAGNHRDHLVFDLALQNVDRAVRADHLFGQARIALFERVERLAEVVLGQAAHLGDLLVEQSEFILVASDNMFVHVLPSWAYPFDRRTWRRR
jgi:hypothetical protein